MTSPKNTQFDHFTQNAPEFTESILWHRVVAVTVAALLVIASLIWGLTTLFSASEETQPKLAEHIQQLPVTHSIPQQDPVEKAAEEDELVAVASVQESPVIAVENQEIEPAEIAVESEEETVTATEKTPETISEVNHSLTIQMEVLNSDISSAALTDKMNGLEPAYALDSTERLTNDFIKLYFYTDLNGRAGDTLTYSWYRNDKRMAKVRIPVGSDRWRSHSSKNFSKNMGGDWQVRVTDKGGNQLARANFTLLPR